MVEQVGADLNLRRVAIALRRSNDGNLMFDGFPCVCHACILSMDDAGWK